MRGEADELMEVFDRDLPFHRWGFAAYAEAGIPGEHRAVMHEEATDRGVGDVFRRVPAPVEVENELLQSIENLVLVDAGLRPRDELLRILTDLFTEAHQVTEVRAEGASLDTFTPTNHAWFLRPLLRLRKQKVLSQVEQTRLRLTLR